MVELPCQEGKSIIYLEEVIERNIDKLFLNYDIISCHPFRVMRNADLSIDEDEAEDLLKEIEQKLKKRQWGEVIRLDIEKKADKRLLDILKKELHVGGHAIYEIDGPLDLTVLMKVFGLPGFDEFKTPPYTPQPVPALMNEDDIFANIRKGDILLTHRLRPLSRSSILSRKLPVTRRCWRSSRHSTVSAATPRLSRRSPKRRTMENRCRFWLS